MEIFFGFIYPLSVKLPPEFVTSMVYTQLLVTFCIAFVLWSLSDKTNKLFHNLLDSEERESLLAKIRQAMEKLRETFYILSFSAQQFIQSTQEVNQNITKIAQNSGEVFDQVKTTKKSNEQILTITNDLAAFAQEVAANSEQADDLMTETMNFAVNEERTVNRFTGKLQEINRKIAETGQTIGYLAKSSERITQVNEVKWSRH